MSFLTFCHEDGPGSCRSRKERRGSSLVIFCRGIRNVCDVSFAFNFRWDNRSIFFERFPRDIDPRSMVVVLMERSRVIFSGGI